MPRTSSLAVLRRAFWLPCLTTAASLGLAWFLSARQVPVYRASATVVVVPNIKIVEAIRDRIDALDTLDRRSVVATLSRLARSSQVLQTAADQAGMKPEDARACSVTTVVLPNTNIVEIDVEGPSAGSCAQLANGIAQVGSSQAMEIYGIYRLRNLEEAAPRYEPVRPDFRQNLSVAGALGLMAGLFLALLREWLRPDPS